MSINKFGGLDTDTAEILLQDDETPDSENVITDEFASLGPRKGFVQYSTTSASNIWTFPHSNGTRYIIIQSGGNILADTGSGLFATTISTVSASDTTVGTVLGDKFYFANKTDGLKYWDTSTVTVASATLKVDNLVTWKGRLAAAGKVGSERTIYLSKFLVGTTWDTPTSPTDDDAAQITVSGALDEKITALYPAFNDILVWFKQTAFGGIYGTRRSNFTQRTFSDRVGTAYRDSIQDCDGILKWLGPQRTVWGFDGTNYKKISEKIDTMMATAAQGDANSRKNSWDSQTDFNLGTNTHTSNNISAGSVQLSTWTDVDTSSSNFAAGALTSLTTSTVVGDLYLSVNNGNTGDNSFEGCGTWTYGSSTNCSGPIYGAKDGSKVVFANTTATGLFAGNLLIESANSGSTLLTTAINVASYGSWQQFSINLSAYKGRYIRYKFEWVAGSSTRNVRTQNIFCSGETLTFWVYRVSSVSLETGIDLFEGGVSSITSGNILSRTLDTAITTPKWIPNTPTQSNFSHTSVFETQTSSDGISFDALATWTSGSAPTSSSKRYIRYKWTITASTSGTALPYISDVTLSARASTGSWISNSVSLGSPSSWGLFESLESLDGGGIVYSLFTDTDSAKTITNGLPVAGSYTTSQFITNNTLPTISTAAYAFIVSTFSITLATQTPSFNYAAINWNEGTQTRVASAWSNQRYWLAVAVNSATNNKVFVHDRNEDWQRYSGISANAMNIHNSNLYFGNASGVFQAESGTSDAGSAIAAYYKTKSWMPSGPDTNATFHDLYMKTMESSASLGTQFFLNGRTSSNSLGSYTMNATDGIQSFKLPFSFGEVQQGRDIGIKWSVSSTSNWQIYNGNLYYRIDPFPN
ncbi:MAG: hypothetical protein EKK55_17450 [Rhodocyclaceae bacterium]|nr:MAG: hypothetical protein EKK55_17450 [Rhodocyclaceae bacterium]